METSNKTTSYNPTPQKIVNTINLDQKQPLVEPTLGKHPNLFDPPHQSVSEKGKMSLNEWFKKPVVFQPNLVWSTTDQVNTVLYTASLLQVLQSIPTPSYLSLSGNAFFRTGINIDLRVSASPFHAGKLVMYYVPPSVDQSNRESINAKCMFPSVFIDAGNNTHGVLHIPFVAIKDYFATQNPDGRSNLGLVRIAVLNNLRIGTGGSPQVTYALSINPTDNDLTIPVKSHTVQIQSLFDFDGSDSISELLHLLKGDFNQDFLQGLHKLGIDKLIKTLTGAPNDFKNAKLIHDIMTANNNGPSPGTPNPPVPDVPSGTTIAPMTDSSAPSLSNKTGLTSEHLSLSPEETDMHTPDQTTDLREMDLQVVSRTPSLLQICNYNSTDDVSARIFTAPITPNLVGGYYATTGTGATPGVVYPTYLQHVTTPFAFWRGSIDFHFSFAATEQHKGKVLVAYLPNDVIDNNGGITITPVDVTSLSVYPNEVFDLSMNRDFTFKVPYNTETEYKNVDFPYILPSDGSAPTRATSLTYSTGTLVMVVYNRLTYPGTVTPNINFNVFVSAGEDFEFHGLRDLRNDIFPVSYIQIQSGNDVIYEASLEGMKREKANVVGVSTRLLSPSSFQSSAEEMKLDKLLSKYQPQYAYSFNLTAGNSRSLVASITPGPVERAARSATLPDPVFRNLITHYKQLYAFWCGSLNHFIIHNSTVNNPVILSVVHVPDVHIANFTPYPNATGTTNNAIAGFISSSVTPNTSVSIYRIQQCIRICLIFVLIQLSRSPLPIDLDSVAYIHL